MSAPMGRMMRIAVAVGVAVMLSAAASTLADEPTTFEVTVKLDSFKFDPASIILEVGDRVQWINADSRRHLMSSVPGTGAGDQLEIFCPDFFPEKSCEHTFNTPGRYPYFCFIHRQMVGEVIVLER